MSREVLRASEHHAGTRYSASGVLRPCRRDAIMNHLPHSLPHLFLSHAPVRHMRTWWSISRELWLRNKLRMLSSVIRTSYDPAGARSPISSVPRVRQKLQTPSDKDLALRRKNNAYKLPSGNGSGHTPTTRAPCLPACTLKYALSSRMMTGVHFGPLHRHY